MKYKYHSPYTHKQLTDEERLLVLYDRMIKALNRFIFYQQRIKIELRRQGVIDIDLTDGEEETCIVKDSDETTLKQSAGYQTIDS